jgi:tRNA A-37 threonylcarbamoyl transferase component Bud32
VTNAADYLRARGVVPPDTSVAVRALSGGVSNIVLLAEWESDALVLKQSLASLRVEADWRFDRRRIFIERDCLKLLGKILPGTAPTVRFSDSERFVFGMSAAPPGGKVWCDELRAGRIDSRSTVAAAQLLGRLQTLTASLPHVAQQFDDIMPLLEGRVDPFHRTVASRHPALAGAIEREIVRMIGERRVLVHGDYSPKNIIIYPGRLLLLDCEVAHWGDPAFDVAFMLCHLLLDGYGPETLMNAATADADLFWNSYRAANGPADDERAVVAELACLLLARADGKSPSPSLRTEQQKEAVRRFGIRLLRDSEVPDVSGTLALALDYLADPEGYDHSHL